MSTTGLGNHGGIRKRIRANHAHPGSKLAVLRLELQLLKQRLCQAMTKEPLEGIIIFSEIMTECQRFSLIENLIEYLNEINYGDFNEQIIALRSLQRHFEMGNLNADDFTFEQAREFMAEHASRIIVIIDSL
ncbi:MAG: hypothetical protein HYX23_01635 [Candidatus Zambryskibacteria bacterium]|nr:hypothetical protein [Candidatus Zambryskibacteria bacterium]